MLPPMSGEHGFFHRLKEKESQRRIEGQHQRRRVTGPEPGETFLLHNILGDFSGRRHLGLGTLMSTVVTVRTGSRHQRGGLFPRDNVGDGSCGQLGQPPSHEPDTKFFECRQGFGIPSSCEPPVSQKAVAEEKEKRVGHRLACILQESRVKAGEATLVLVDLLHGIEKPLVLALTGLRLVASELTL